MNNRIFDLLVFDLDGTLLETRHDIASSVNFLRKQKGMTTLDTETISAFIGDGIQLLIGRALHTDDQDAVREGIEIFRDHYWDHCMDQSYIYPGVVETLDRFHPAKKLAVATNKREDFSRKMIRGFNLDKYFTMIIGGDSLPFKKPDSQVLEHIMEFHNISPDRVVMTGDSATDIKAGKNAGVTTVGVTYGIGDIRKLLDAKPDYVIDTFDKLNDVIH